MGWVKVMYSVLLDGCPWETYVLWIADIDEFDPALYTHTYIYNHKYA